MRLFPARGRSIVAAAALLVGVLLAASRTAAGRERLPYDVAVQVEYAGPPGSRTLLDEVGGSLVDELAARGCFRSFRLVPPAAKPPEDALVLRVSLDDLRDELRYDQSLAQQAQPGEPGDSLQYSALFSVEVRLALLAPPGAAVVREKEFRESVRRRPLTVGEDAREAARSEAILELARKARASLCHGSPDSLRRSLDAAGIGPAESTPSR